MPEIVDFSPVAASNNSAVPNGAPEGWAPSSVNNVQREVMARNKREELDTNGSLTLGGGTTAYTLSVYRDTAAAYQGETIKAKVNATNTGAVTVTITPGAAGVVGAGVARGAVAVQRGTLALVAGDWIVGDIVEFTYDGTQYQMVTPPRAVTGTGKMVRDTAPTINSPALVTPALGAATATSIVSANTVNVSDGDLEVKGQRIQSFTLIITNTAGTLQHQMYGDNQGGALGSFISKVTGASATLANTPTVGVGTDFTSGGGLRSTAGFQFNTAAQTQADQCGGVVVARGASLLSNPMCDLFYISTNVNGVTRTRPELEFFLATTGASWPINTTNIPAGDSITVRVNPWWA